MLDTVSDSDGLFLPLGDSMGTVANQLYGIDVGVSLGVRVQSGVGTGCSIVCDGVV